MELQAELKCLYLQSPDPEQAARFYSRSYGMAVSLEAGVHVCQAPRRELRLLPGPANQLACAHFVFKNEAAWQAFLGRTAALEKQLLPDELSLLKALAVQGRAVGLRDPDGNLTVFSAPLTENTDSASISDLPAATLQHFALRTPNLPAMLAFYAEQLGFVLSDAVKDPEGQLRACFLRVDALHHTLALFFAPVSCFDHQSFETTDWASMKTWGDHMAAIRVPIVWGIGRHGPGNDVFFMVRDPDGNLAEISSEIEHCEAGRPAGLWAHEERTLNLWGKAILRS